MTCTECDRSLANPLSVCLCEMDDSMLEVTLKAAVVAASLGVSGMGSRVSDIEDEQLNRSERTSQLDLDGEGAACISHRNEQEMEHARSLK